MRKIIRAATVSAILIASGAQLSAQSETAKQAYTAYQSKDYQGAADLFIQAIKADAGNAQYHKDLGICYQRLRRYPEAIAELEKAAALDKTIADIYPPLALAYIKTGNMDKAVAAFGTYAQSPGASPSILGFSYKSLGEIYAGQGKKLEASAVYIKSGNSFYAAGEFDPALESYAAAEAIAPSAEISAAKGACYAKSFRSELAVDAYKDAAKRKPASLEYQQLLGQAYYANRDFAKSAEQSIRLAELDPAQNDIYMSKAISAYRQQAEKHIAQKEYDRALEAYETARTYDRENESDYRGLNASVYAAMGDDSWEHAKYSEAESHYSEAVKLRPSAEYLLKKGKAHLKLEEWDRAIIAISSSIEKESSAVAYRDLGNALYGKAFEDKNEKSNENFLSAIQSYKKAMELDIDYTEMYGWLGLAYVQLAMADDAEEASAKAEANFVDKEMLARLNFGIADLHRYNDAKKNARKYFEKVVANESAPVNILAYSHFYLGNSDKAYQLLNDNLTEALDGDSAPAEAYFSLASLYSKDKQVPQAIANLRKALEKGFTNFKVIPVEMEMYPLHDNPEFLALQKEFNFKVKYVPKHIQEQQFLQLNPTKMDGLDYENAK